MPRRRRRELPGLRTVQTRRSGRSQFFGVVRGGSLGMRGGGHTDLVWSGLEFETGDLGDFVGHLYVETFPGVETLFSNQIQVRGIRRVQDMIKR